MGLMILAAAQGVIQHATINNLAFGRSVEETLRILQAIQYVQENPDEVHFFSSLYSLHRSCQYCLQSMVFPCTWGTPSLLIDCIQMYCCLSISVLYLGMPPSLHHESYV